MPYPFPHEYKIELEQVDGSLATLSGEHEPRIQGAPPVHFDGPGGTWSPETLLLGAVQLCYLTTLVALARRKDLAFGDFSSSIRGYLDKGPQGIGFTRIELDVKLRIRPEQRELAEQMLQAAKKHCIISNALKTEVTLNVEIKEDLS